MGGALAGDSWWKLLPYGTRNAGREPCSTETHTKAHAHPAWAEHHAERPQGVDTGSSGVDGAVLSQAAPWRRPEAKQELAERRRAWAKPRGGHLHELVNVTVTVAETFSDLTAK